MMHGCCQCVQIRTRVCIPLILLRWCVPRRTERRGLLAYGVARLVCARDTEVYQVSAPILCADDDVSGFDISMHNRRRLLREVIQDVEYLGGAQEHIALF